LEYFVHGLSVLVVFPFSFLISVVLFRLRRSEPGFPSGWRAWVSGALTAVMIWSGAGERIISVTYSLGPNFPGRDLVAVLSPFSKGLFFSHLLVWGRRPWGLEGRTGGIRYGGGFGGNLPPGVLV